MTFLQPLQTITRVDNKLNTDMATKLNLSNIISETENYQSNWLQHIGYTQLI
jgi:hypothetical protein